MLIPRATPGDAEPHAEPGADSRTRSQPRRAAGPREERGVGAEAPAGQDLSLDTPARLPAPVRARLQPSWDMAQGSGDTEAGGSSNYWGSRAQGTLCQCRCPGSWCPQSGSLGQHRQHWPWGGCFGTAWPGELRGRYWRQCPSAPAPSHHRDLWTRHRSLTQPRSNPRPWVLSGSPARWVPRTLCAPRLSLGTLVPPKRPVPAGGAVPSVPLAAPQAPAH